MADTEFYDPEANPRYLGGEEDPDPIDPEHVGNLTNLLSGFNEALDCLEMPGWDRVIAWLTTEVHKGYGQLLSNEVTDMTQLAQVRARITAFQEVASLKDNWRIRRQEIVTELDKLRAESSGEEE